jgi:RNA polymerase sigma factor (sigma-70 family)
MGDGDWLAERFQAHGLHLRAVAYRMLGSLSEADDALQEAWLRASRAGTGGVDNLGGWLTTVVARVCLDMLRSRTARREEPLGTHLPDPIVGHGDTPDPEQEALLAEGVGLALLVVLDTLAPAERLALVLHDSFAVPFEEIAAILGRSPAATRQLASRARRRIRAAAPVPDTDLAHQQTVVDAFLAAARNGDLDALVEVLDPDVVVRADWGRVPAGASRTVRGARAVAEQALSFSRRAPLARPVLVNGAAGVVVAAGGRPVAVMGFTVRHDRVVEIDILADPARLRRLELTVLPAVPVDHRVQGVAGGGPEVGADTVGDRDQRRLHHRLERDPQQLGRLPLMTQMEGGPHGPEPAGPGGEHEAPGGGDDGPPP